MRHHPKDEPEPDLAPEPLDRLLVLADRLAKDAALLRDIVGRLRDRTPPDDEGASDA